MKKWKTAISTRKNNELFIRGVRHLDLVERSDFIASLFLLWRGTLPSANEKTMFEAILVSAIEHGIDVPSSVASRIAVSTGNQMNSALASGILALGRRHGGAIEGAALLLQSGEAPDEIVRRIISSKEKIPGFGHRLYKEKDPRAEALFLRAQKIGFFGVFAKKAHDIKTALERASAKILPINFDGAMAALLLELGFDPRILWGIFIFARTAGLIAHAQEELDETGVYRHLDEEDIEYTGK